MDDETLLARFASCALTTEQWSHRLHLRVAYLLLRRHPFEEALDRLRAGIQATNRAHDVRESLTAGYHETLTVAWLTLVAARMGDAPVCLDSDGFCDRNPDLLDKSRLRAFYSPERIASWIAKRGFVEPDRAPLPGTGAVVDCGPTGAEQGQGRDDR